MYDCDIKFDMKEFKRLIVVIQEPRLEAKRCLTLFSRFCQAAFSTGVAQNMGDASDSIKIIAMFLQVTFFIGSQKHYNLIALLIINF